MSKVMIGFERLICWRRRVTLESPNSLIIILIVVVVVVMVTVMVIVMVTVAVIIAILYLLLTH